MSTVDSVQALTGSMRDFREPQGPDLMARVGSFYEWQEQRRKRGLWPYSKSTQEAPLSVCMAADDSGQKFAGLNFGTQDYLGLSSDPEIKAVARRQLADSGADGLSLRAVSRELEMVSSALYRYFPSRDDLLTALIVDAYRSLGEAAAEAESAVRRPDLGGRFLATASATRRWAVEHRHEWALIFGSPIPGYAAPPDTIDPAAQIPLLLLAIAADATAAGVDAGGADVAGGGVAGGDVAHAADVDQADGVVPASRTAAAKPPMPRSVRADLRNLRQQLGGGPDDRQLARWVGAWIAIVGTVSFELFGHLHNVITDYEAFFDHQMRTLAIDLGLERHRSAETRISVPADR